MAGNGKLRDVLGVAGRRADSPALPDNSPWRRPDDPALPGQAVSRSALERSSSEVLPSIVAHPWRGYVPIALVTLLGIVITASAFREVTDWERQRVQSAFRNAAHDQVLVIQRAISYYLTAVEDIGSLFDASRWVGRRDFRNFVGPTLERRTGIQALEWVPRVTNEERAVFEQEARRSFQPFRITERGPDGELVEAGPRPEYFPVLYVQPYKLNKPRLGLDLASEPAALEALRQARDAGRMQIAYLGPPQASGESGATFTAQLPVYNKSESLEQFQGESDTPPDSDPAREQAALRGFALGRFQIDIIVERALESLSAEGIDISLFDLTYGKRLLYHHASRLGGDGEADDNAAAGGLVDISQLDVAGRRWEVVSRAVPGHYRVDPWSGWAVLAGGLAFTTLLTVYLATLVGRAAEVRRLVAQRTWQLVNANAALNREIGERKRAEQQLHGLNETLEQRVARRTAEAEQRAQELEQFAYVASHDLKAPLRGISNLTTWLQEDMQGKLNDGTREQLNLLQDRVRRMHTLIQGLLEYSRVGRVEGSLETVDTGKLVAEIIDSLAPPPDFRVDVSPDMPTLRTDRLQLGQVFANLIGNSLKHHGGEQGHVWISVLEQGPFYEFSVGDDGKGIPAEYQDKVFMMFQTLEVRDYGADTGIGLALAKKIVREHNGDIVLQSAAGKGATFRFTWPKDG